MSKKKAQFCYVQLLWENRPYVVLSFYDQKERRMLSSVDVVLNVEYHDDEAIAAFATSR